MPGRKYDKGETCRDRGVATAAAAAAAAAADIRGRFSQEKQQFKNWVTVLTGVRERTAVGQLAEVEVPQKLGPQGASLRRRRQTDGS